MKYRGFDIKITLNGFEWNLAVSKGKTYYTEQGYSSKESATEDAKDRIDYMLDTKVYTN